MNKPKFSICVIAKDEAGSLTNLLESLKRFRERGGEIILLDTGSKDETAAVAQKYGASIIKSAPDQFVIRLSRETARAINAQFVAPGDPPVVLTGMKLFDYGVARTYVARYASNDFVFEPDADEVFNALDVDTINQLIDRGWNRFNVWFIDNPENQFFYDSRWYDRRCWWWKGTMHETLYPMGVASVTQVPPEACTIQHHQHAHQNRSQYLANLAYSFFMDPKNERQAHCFARQMMYEGRYKSSIEMFMRHVMMEGGMTIGV